MGPFVSSGPVHQHCIFPGKERAAARPSITAEAASGTQCHRSVPRERAPRAPRARPLLPGRGCAEPGCQATHVPTHMHTQEECSAHWSARLCAHVHASMEISRHPHGCTHMHPHANVRRMPCAHMYASAEISMCMHHACAPMCTRKPLLLRPRPGIPGSGVFTGKARRAGHGQEAGRWLSLSCSWTPSARTPQRPSARPERGMAVPGPDTGPSGPGAIGRPTEQTAESWQQRPHCPPEAPPGSPAQAPPHPTGRLPGGLSSRHHVGVSALDPGTGLALRHLAGRGLSSSLTAQDHRTFPPQEAGAGPGTRLCEAWRSPWGWAQDGGGMGPGHRPHCGCLRLHSLALTPWGLGLRPQTGRGPREGRSDWPRKPPHRGSRERAGELSRPCPARRSPDLLPRPAGARERPTVTRAGSPRRSRSRSISWANVSEFTILLSSD